MWKVKLFIDSANIEEIKAASELGVISGVTTNPSLIARERRDFVEVVREITAIVDGPISAEVVSLTADSMIAEGENLAALHPNIVVKIPMNAEGLKAVRALSQKGIRTNITLVFSVNQALLAALAGAAYASPFVGRLDDIGHNGIELVKEISQLYKIHGLSTQIISASIRHPLHVAQSAGAGAHIATVPYNVLIQMLKHPLTDLGIEQFLADWAKVPKK